MITRLWLAIQLIIRKDVTMMLIRLFAAEVLAGRLTIEQIPARLRPLVEQYINALTTLPGEGE